MKKPYGFFKKIIWFKPDEKKSGRQKSYDLNQMKKNRMSKKTITKKKPDKKPDARNRLLAEHNSILYFSLPLYHQITNECVFVTT